MSNISQRLDLKHSQNLVMTPQLQQAIKLLQMNNVELAEFVEGELAQNPLLEKGDTEEGGSADDAVSESPAADSGDDIQEEFDRVWTGNAQESTPPADFDPGSSMANVGAGGSRSFDDREDSFESRLTRETTLRDHLLEQMNMAFEDGRDRFIGAQIIDLLDEAGYVRHDLQDLTERLACPPERLERLFAEMKLFSPPGIFARDLKECLQLQLEDQGKLDVPMKALLEHLDLLAAHNMTALMARCGVNETYLKDMIQEIRALNPRPASAFDHLLVQTVVPDVLMKRLPKDVGGGWRVELNNETLPRVLINQKYFTEVAGRTKDKKDKEYLNQQMQSANWLVRAMDQRAKTILKVAGEIIEQQDAFFLYGVEFLRPMTLKDIALVIDMHESTVSRVTNNKYIGTPRGIFELKYFFSTALGEGENAHSSESVRARIKSLIDAEDPQKTLSDDAIVDVLKKDGIEIARRTVAKYREGMNIPSSVQRRRQKKSS